MLPAHASPAVTSGPSTNADGTPPVLLPRALFWGKPGKVFLAHGGHREHERIWRLSRLRNRDGEHPEPDGRHTR